ncbi:hypothetical protein PIB30_076471 [Stylosanthes scabra]|uniref:Uncharacterized protein n=1 Tax=Stylosanthes scabra TaxID=79078 RepID=A0ABU6TPT4_9FABA|nr:hypothetical protein [Stylosanthes scabra]
MNSSSESGTTSRVLPLREHLFIGHFVGIAQETQLIIHSVHPCVDGLKAPPIFLLLLIKPPINLGHGGGVACLVYLGFFALVSLVLAIASATVGGSCEIYVSSGIAGILASAQRAAMILGNGRLDEMSDL